MDLMEQVFSAVHISGAEGWIAQQGEKHLDTMHLDQGQDQDQDAESRQIPPTQDADADAKLRQIPPTQGNIGNGPSSSNIGNGPSSSSRPRASKKRYAESRQNPPTQGNTGNGPSSSNIGNGPSSSSRPRASKKRSRFEQAGQAVAEVIRDSVQSLDKILSHKNQLIESHPEFSCSQLRAMEVLHSLPAIRMWSTLYKAAIQHLKQDIANRQTFLFYEDDENKVLYLEFATGESRDA